MTICAVVLLGTLCQIANVGSRMAVSLLAIGEGVPTVLIGSLLALFSLPPMLFALFGGRMIDRVGIRAPLIGATGAMTTVLLLAALVPQVWFLFLFAAVVGLAQNLTSLALLTAIGSMGVPEDRTANMSWLSLGYSSGLFVGPVLTGYLIEWVGQRPTFAVLALFPGAALGFIWLLNAGAMRSGAAGQRRFHPKQILELLRHPKLRGALIAGVIVSGGWDMFSFVMPVHGAAIGLSASAIGIIIGAYGLASASVRAMLPLFHRQMPEWTLLAAAMLISGTLFLVFPFVAAPAALTVLAFLLGLALGGAQPTAVAIVLRYAPVERRGEVIGVRSSMMNAVHTSMPLVFGALGSALGMAPLFLVVAGVLFLGGYRSKTHWGRGEAGEA